MRKMLIALCGVLTLSGVASANSPYLTETVNRRVLASSDTSAVALSAVEVVGGVRKVLNTTYVSRSNPNHSLCWEVVGVARSHADGHRVQEVIVSPAFMRFIDPNASIYSGDNGTRHIIDSVVSGTADSANKCWKFDSTDPVGNYTLTLTVSGVPFTALPFTVEP